MGLRIVTDSVKNCYGALGVIHNEWRPVPGRIKDFIAIPRPNLYQSLHTSVVGPEGRHFEIQIRTEEMHRIAEEGIAAHWKYKEGKKGVQDDQRVAWLRQLVEWQQDMRNPGDFDSTLRLDLYPEEVYCFTPKGRVIALPAGSTPVDFAYAVHSEVGNTCTGAKVNGRIVQLKYALRNGDIVDILTTAGHQPSKDWLASSRRRARATTSSTSSTRASASAPSKSARSIWRRKRAGWAFSLPRIRGEELERVAGEYGLGKMEDLIRGARLWKIFGPSGAAEVRARTGSGGRRIRGTPTPNRSSPARREPSRRRRHQSPRHRRSDGLSRQMLQSDPRRSHRRLCHARQRHRRPFPPVPQRAESDVRLRAQNRRGVGAQRDETFPVRIVVHTDDRPGLLHQFTSALSDEKTNVRSLEARTDFSQTTDAAVVEMTVDVRDKKQLEKLCTAMRRISGIRDVERTHQS